MNNKIQKPALQLPRTMVNQILAHAQQNPEEEICGLISVKENSPSRYFRISNIAKDKTHHFEMSGAEQIAAMKNIREYGEELLAIVHSHPDAPAIPSTLDKEQDNYPDVYYLVVSLNTKGVLELRSFLLEEEGDNKTFKPAELFLEQPAADKNYL